MLQKFLCGWTQLLKRAIQAVRFSRVTDLSPMPDQHIAKGVPIIPGYELHQVELDLLRVIALRQSKSLRYTSHVSVHHNARVDPVRSSQDAVGSLATNAAELHEILHRLWNLPILLFRDRLAASDNALRFASEESCRSDLLFELLLVGVREILRSPVFLEERGSDHVHPDIRALRRENRRNQKLKRVGEIERDLGIGVRFMEKRDDFLRAIQQLLGGFFLCHIGLQLRVRQVAKKVSTFRMSHVFATSFASNHPLRAIPTP